MSEWCEVEITLNNLFRMNDYRHNKCRVLFELASKTKGYIVELGAYHGMSTIALSMASDNVYTVDAYLPRTGHAGELYGPNDKKIFRRNIQQAGVSPTLMLMTIEEAAGEWVQPTDLIFWDTGVENCLIDHFRLWQKFIKPGGLFLVHDTQDYKLGWAELAVTAGISWQIEEHYPMHGLRRL